ncbi:MAG: hypothetical protein ACLR9T_02220 [Thomasclavelia sp.]|uniref:hypothetical protein n=1 Tax=Thomasclavelia sp. TaxID=3025757 RepID=UPI0039A09B35
MKESKYELKNWKRWKHTLMLLNNTKEQVEIKKTSLVNDDHSEIIEKTNNLIEECKQYDEIIFYYQFFIERLEHSINDLLNEEEKNCVLIYANDPDNSSKREYNALEKGISRTTYYKILSNACNKLDKVLAPIANKHSTKEL